MTPELRDRLATILERPHRLGMIGGDLGRQIDHCQAFLAVLGEIYPADTTHGAGSAKKSALDLGTGGGIPGLALALARPDIDWALLDSRTSRAAEVERCVAKAGIGDRVHVLAAEAQHVAHEPRWRQSFDIVVARAFGPPSFTAECASGFLRPGGSLIVSEPPSSDDHPSDNHPSDSQVDRWDPAGLNACGFARGIWHVESGMRFVQLQRLDTDTDLPRLPARKDRGWPQSFT